MTAARSFLLHRVRAIVRPSALTFRGGDQKIVADHSKSAGIPTCRDKAECALGRNIVNRIAGVYTRYIEYGDCVQRRIGDKDRKSTRLNSSHLGISYAVFCLKKKK